MDRPGFETYSMVNMDPMYNPYMMPMTPYNTQSSCQNNKSNKLQTLENEINNLKLRVSRLENSLYPEAIDYSKISYQNSLNMI